MKRLIHAILLLLLIIITASCGTKTIYVPIENTKVEKEYVDRWLKDSVYLHDSIFVKHKGDTVWLERYKTIYKEKLVRDSVFVTDSIQVSVPYPVDNPIPYYPKWLVVLALLGTSFIFMGVYRLIRFFKP